jgi:TIR domain
VAVIGPEWVTAADEQGHRRLDDPHDEVRLAIQTALERGVPVIPVLVDRAKMPSQQQLPSELHELVQFFPVEMGTFILRHEADQLIARIKLTLARPDIGQDAAAGLSRPGRWADAAAASVPGAKAEGATRAQGPQFGRPKIFLCYRREDTQGFVRGIYGNLAEKYGHEQVFRDIDSIPAGVRWSAWIESRVSQCSIMIVLIGNTWLSAKDNAGKRRLDSPKDWVRQEIKTALTRGIPIIPVRVQGAPMPSEEDLPPSIADLTAFQSAEVTDSRWDYDVGRLVEAIDNLIASG